MNAKRIKDFGKKYGLIILALIAVLMFTFWKGYILQYTLSSTNLMYSMEPWNTLGVEVEGPLLSDNADSVLPSVFSMFQGDGISLWNPDIAMGFDQEIYILLFPLYYIYKLPYKAAILITTITKLSLAFISMFAFLRSYKLNKPACTVGGMCYMFCSTMVTWLFWPHTYVIAIAPFAFLAAKNLIETVKLKYSLWLAVIIALMLLAGMPTYAAYFMYLLGAWVIFYSVTKYWKNKKNILKVCELFAVGVILAVLMSLPYTMELVGSIGANGYSDSRAGLSSLILPVDYIRTMVFPYFREGMSYHINESTVFTGILSLVLLPFAVFYQKDKKQYHNIFWCVMWVFVMVLIFTHSLDFFFGKLPVINTSSKLRLIVLENFITCIMVAVSLHHIIEYREKYKKKIWMMCIGFAVTACFIGYQAVSVADIEEIWPVIVMGVVYAAMLVLIVLAGKQFLITAGSVLIVIVNGINTSQFAQEYLPWIGKDASVIPQATDTIQFLENNTQGGERYVALGNWVLFPNTNIYYGLNTILAHGFVNTNEDIKQYLSKIDSDIYVTATKTAAGKIENNKLTGYAGVKYIIDKASSEPIAQGGISPVGVLSDGVVVEQTFKSPVNKLYELDIFCATYGVELSGEYTLYYELNDTSDGQVVSEGEVPCNEITDNSALRIRFDVIDKAYNKEFTLRIWTDITDDGQLLTLWKAAEPVSSDSKLTYDGENDDGCLNISCLSAVREGDIYGRVVFSGRDGLTVYEQTEYASKAFLADTVVTKATEKEVLREMSKEYNPNTVFFSEEELEKENVTLHNTENTSLAENEKVEIEEYKNDIITLNVTTKEARYLVLTDYYADDWNVYIDGEKADVQKGNYLFRSVYIDSEGTHKVVFRYEPVEIYTYLKISGATFSGVVIAMILCYCRQQKKNKQER